ncbi:MAG: phospholipase [Bacteroidota bacterium]
MQPTAHRLPVQRTAHFYTLGEPSANVKRMWFACHGYGQLASTFIRKFDQLAGAEDYVVAPEGLSRFYWQGFTGKVVASWMTSADRLDEIADYSAMLSTIFHQQKALLSADVEVILFGFSQGCATTMRWMLREQPNFDHLWLWAGQVPEDVSYDEVREHWNTKQLHAFFGAKDPLISPDRLKLLRRFITESGLQIQEHTYEGDHRVIREVLAQQVANLLKG